MLKSRLIKLTIPTNWSDELISVVNRETVDVFYGKLSSDFLGGGRPSYCVPQVSSRDAIAHIRKIKNAGFRFNYLLNSTCLDNIEWTAKGQRKLRALLEWIISTGAQEVTVAIPYLLEVVKKSFSSLRVCVSTSAKVNSPERARYWQDLGADVITLDSVVANRNFGLMRRIRAAVNCELQVIANVNCLANCSLRNYHCSGISHASQAGHPCRGFFVDYSHLMCSYERIIDPVNIIRGDWIRPEDLGKYEAVGIDRVKLVDRNMPTEILSKIINAYVRRRYDGNLLDLFPSPQKTFMHKKFGFIHKARYFFRPLLINPFKLLKAKELRSDFFYIDNRSLDNFLDFFLHNDCAALSCEKCGYCQSVADKTVVFDRNLQQKFIREYGSFLDELISGTVFRYP